MEKTWRWFGKKDEITLTMLRQIGVEGIVTALHDVPNGEVWPLETVKEMKEYIESAGLRWSVVESLPVCEAIKYAGPDRDRLITNYIQSLTNLGKAGIKTVCYNFMPVIDWIRTDLNHPWPDGTTSLYFNKTRFAYFDLKILKRKHAEKDYSEKELMEVEKLGSRITGEEELELIDPRVLSEETILDLLDFRIALEIGISSDIFRKITPKDIEELSEIVKMGIVFENNEYALISESAFHTKLYKITGNKIISEFQEIIHPILVYVKEKFKDYLKPINIEMSKSGRIATHADLLDFIRKGDEKGYRDAIERHFEVYKIFKVNRSLELMAEKNEEERIDSI